MKKTLLFFAALVVLITLCTACTGKPPKAVTPSYEDSTDAPAQDASPEDASEGGEASSPLLLKLATTALPESTTYQAIEMFKNRVEQDSDGSIEIQLYPASQLGDQQVIVEGLQIGTIELAFLPIDAAENSYPGVSLLTPLFSASQTLSGEALYESEQGRQILDGLQKKTGLRCLGFSVEGVRNIWSKQPIETLRDLEGLKLWVSQSNMTSRVFQSFGVQPAQIAPSLIYDGLQAGLFDGFEVDDEVALEFSLYERCKYCAQTAHAITTYAFLMNDSIFAAMTATQQQIVQAAAGATADWLTEVYANRRASVQADLESHNVQFYTLSRSVTQQLEALAADAVKTYTQDFSASE